MFCRLECPNNELLYRVGGLALQCMYTLYIARRELLCCTSNYDIINSLFTAEIGDFSAQRCGLSYVTEFELIPILVS